MCDPQPTPDRPCTVSWVRRARRSTAALSTCAHTSATQRPWHARLPCANESANEQLAMSRWVGEAGSRLLVAEAEREAIAHELAAARRHANASEHSCDNLQRALSAMHEEVGALMAAAQRSASERDGAAGALASERSRASELEALLQAVRAGIASAQADTLAGTGSATNGTEAVRLAERAALAEADARTAAAELRVLRDARAQLEGEVGALRRRLAAAAATGSEMPAAAGEGGRGSSPAQPPPAMSSLSKHAAVLRGYEEEMAALADKL
ncbi:hypothetical protein T492DRAFT_844692 [Pavlovales sp. CCMP2436]|nr:hypothetical protein T492DRAFT_844692 [Pavlovales sp. CCMP2436]